MRRFGQAIVFVLAFLIIVAEVQRSEDAAAMEEAHALYGARKP